MMSTQNHDVQLQVEHAVPIVAILRILATFSLITLGSHVDPTTVETVIDERSAVLETFSFSPFFG